MMALPLFLAQNQGDPALDVWLKQGKPLSLLKSLRTILDLDHAWVTLKTHAPGPAGRGAEPAPRPPRWRRQRRPETAAPDEGPIVLGTTNDRTAKGW